MELYPVLQALKSHGAEGAALMAFLGLLGYAIRALIPGILEKMRSAGNAGNNAISALMAHVAASNAMWEKFTTNHLEHERLEREAFIAFTRECTDALARMNAAQAETLDHIKRIRDKQDSAGEKLAKLEGWMEAS